jgi:hypothetical protein
MRRAIFAMGTFALAAVGALVVVERAASQSPVKMSPQIQIIGAAANNTSHGAWIVDLQSKSVIFCERAATRMQCQATALP